MYYRKSIWKYPSIEESIFPSEEFELTTYSLVAHIETHGGLILRTLSYLTVNSQDDSLWAFCEFATHTVTLLWDHPDELPMQW